MSSMTSNFLFWISCIVIAGMILPWALFKFLVGGTSTVSWVFSGIGVTVLVGIGKLVYGRLKKKETMEMKTMVESGEVKLNNSIVNAPIVGRDMHIGAVHIASSSTPSLVAEEYHERPTPREMNEQISKVPMYSQEKIADNYRGLKIKWTGVVSSVRELSNGIVDFTMKYDGHIVCMKARIDDYPILKTVHGKGGELVTATGTIDYVQSNGPVHLKDVKLTFSFPSKVK